jgi:ABC-type phosphate/phosphonate transport system ATPase subunit
LSISFLGPQLVTEAITQHQHLVLLGEPGSGKSTALRYLALTLAQAGLDESVNQGGQRGSLGHLFQGRGQVRVRVGTYIAEGGVSHEHSFPGA